MVKLKDLEKSKDRELAKYIEQLCDTTHDMARQIIDRITYRNILYRIGEQYVEFVRSAGTFRRKIQSSFIPTPVCNEIKDYVRSLKAMLLNQKLVPKVVPNTSEIEDDKAAKLGSNVLEWMDSLNDQEFADEKEKLVIW